MTHYLLTRTASISEGGLLRPADSVESFRTADRIRSAGSVSHVQSVATMAPALATIALGMVVLFCVGFLQTPAVHNGTHDTRHANGFPCH